MTIGLLLITHSGIGQAFIDTIECTFETLPMPMKALSIGKEADPEAFVHEALRLIKSLDTGHGVLVLTDILGSTPSNIAQQVQSKADHVKVIAGLNLPMLFRIINYRTLPLKALSNKAISGGREGIITLSELDFITISKRKSFKQKRSKPEES